MELTYKRFVATGPGIDDFERELCRFVAVEGEIAHVAPLHNIGALSLNTNNLKQQLGQECRAWKMQYSRRVHEMARSLMTGLLDYTRLTTGKLQREVVKLDDLRFVMEVLREVRERESAIEMEIQPLEGMLDMLDRFVPGGLSREEMDQRSVIRPSWRKLVDFAEEVSDRLSGVQGTFKRQLVQDSRAFAQDTIQFRQDYVKNG